MKTKEILKSVLQLSVVLFAIFTITNFNLAFAATLPFSPEATAELKKGDIIIPPQGEGLDIAEQLVFGALGYVKAITVAIGILMITIIGTRLVMSNGNEEDVTKARQALIYAIIAFVIISMSQELAKIFDMKDGTIIQSPQSILNRYRLFDRQVQIFMTFIKYVIATYATIFAVRSGIALITSGDQEEEVTKHKQGMAYSAAGLFLLYIGEIFIERVFYKIDKNVYSGITGIHPSLDAKVGIDQLAGITNLFVSVLGPVAVLALIGGAIMYATAAGEEERMEKGKRIVVSSIIAIVIIYSAFAIVSTVISSRLTDLNALIQ